MDYETWKNSVVEMAKAAGCPASTWWIYDIRMQSAWREGVSPATYVAHNSPPRPCPPGTKGDEI